jgi:hypothetical protein
MGKLYGVESAFLTVLLVVVAIGIVGAVAGLASTGKLYEGIGKGAFALDEEDRPKGPEPGSAAAKAEADAEIRQMVEAKSARREARGEAPLDVEAEIAALTRPPGGGADEELREEVRQLVTARNERRVARGQAPLDVEAEVDRQLRELGA